MRIITQWVTELSFRNQNQKMRTFLRSNFRSHQSNLASMKSIEREKNSKVFLINWLLWVKTIDIYTYIYIYIWNINKNRSLLLVEESTSTQGFYFYSMSLLLLKESTSTRWVYLYSRSLLLLKESTCTRGVYFYSWSLLLLLKSIPYHFEPNHITCNQVMLIQDRFISRTPTVLSSAPSYEGRLLSLHFFGNFLPPGKTNCYDAGTFLKKNKYRQGYAA